MPYHWLSMTQLQWTTAVENKYSKHVSDTSIFIINDLTEDATLHSAQYNNLQVKIFKNILFFTVFLHNVCLANDH